MLRLEAEAVAVPVHMPRLPDDGAVQEVPRVELKTRLRRADVERPPAHRLDPKPPLRETCALPLQHEVMVVPQAVPDLWVILIDAGADGGGCPEVERRPRNGRELARG